MMTFLHRPLLILALALPPLGAQPTRLELGKTVEAELSGGKSHQYVVTMRAGQFARIIVSLPGVETVVRLSEPSQKGAPLELHWPGASSSPEPLCWIARTAGGFRLELKPAEQDQLWLRGGFPSSFLASSQPKSMVWRQNLINTYLQRDIPAYGTRIPAETLRRLWTMLAHSQGGLLDVSMLGKNLMLDAKTVHRYLDLFVDLMLLRRLSPWHSNTGKRMVKSPKLYIRDSGLVHALLGIVSTDDVLAHPVVGNSWEGFVIEALLNAAPVNTSAGFYRTSNGAEIDLVMNVPGHGVWAIEIKRGLGSPPRRGFYNACEDIAPNKRLAVYPTGESYQLGAGVEAVGLRTMIELLRECRLR